MSRPVKKGIPRRSGLGAFISIGITMSVIFSVLALAIALQPEAEGVEVEPSLIVEDVYFIMASSTDADSREKTITMSAFITNQGKMDAVNVKVRAFAMDTESNLAEHSNEATIGTLPQDSTGEAILVLYVPEGKTYRIELLVFESNKIVVRGSGTVKLSGSTGSAGEDFKTTRSDPQNEALDDKVGDGSWFSGTEGSMGAKESSSAIAASAALGILIIVIIAVVAVALIPGKKDENRNWPQPISNFNNNNNNQSAVNAPAATQDPKPVSVVYKTEV